MSIIWSCLIMFDPPVLFPSLVGSMKPLKLQVVSIPKTLLFPRMVWLPIFRAFFSISPRVRRTALFLEFLSKDWNPFAKPCESIKCNGEHYWAGHTLTYSNCKLEMIWQDGKQVTGASQRSFRNCWTAFQRAARVARDDFLKKEQPGGKGLEG